jgi:hypothetical protein
MEDRMPKELPGDPPELEEVLRKQKSELGAIRSRSEQAPPRLRSWLLQELARRRRERRRRFALAAAGAAAAATVIMLLVVVLPGGSGEVTVADAAAAGTRQATEPAPPPSHRNEYLLARSLERVPFPNWRDRGWRATGARRDRIDGREAETVFYERPGRRVAYTIVSGSPLRRPDGAHSVRERVELTTLNLGGRAVVTWHRKGHTCVLSDSGAPPQELLSLASWSAGGKIPY